MADGTRQFFLSSLGERRLAVPLQCVQRVVAMVEVTPLPTSAQESPNLRGVINVQGQVMPVADIRTTLGLPEHEAQLSDRLLILQGHRSMVALVAEAVHGIVVVAAEAVFTLDVDRDPIDVTAKGPEVARNTRPHAFNLDGEIILVQNPDELL